MNYTKINLKSLTRDELTSWMVSLGEKPFRAEQIWSWMYIQYENDFQKMTTLSKKLRETFITIADIASLHLVKVQQSKTGTYKYLWKLTDNNCIESVFIPDNKRKTICISSQVGCQMACHFCATATMGMKRNLAVHEIVDQVVSIAHDLHERPTNLVVMGMGEPFNNYENVIKALYILNDQNGMALSHRKITISTSGIVPQIIRYTEERHPFQLAISLNATTDEKRNELMPVNKSYPIRELMQAAKTYTKRNKKRITFEYVLLAGHNDTKEDAKRLMKLLKSIPCKLNLIGYNATTDQFQRPQENHIQTFLEWISPLNAPVTLRLSKGLDINGACGQLVTSKDSDSY